MNFRSSRLRAGLLAALLLALSPVSSSPARASRSRTSVASGGAVARPFSPALPDITVQIGLPARTNPHAENFARLLTEEAKRIGAARG